MRTMIRPIVMTLATVLLAACGGGGGGGDDRDFAVATAWQGLIAPGAVRTLAAAGRGSDGNNYAIQLRFTPLGPSVYPKSGTTASRTDQRTEVSVNGGAPFVGVQSLYYTGAAQLIGASADGACADIVTTLPPATAKVGDDGPLYTATDYASCASGDTTVVSRSTARWSIENIGGTVFYCTNITYRNVANNPVGTESDCIQVNTDGSFGTRVRIELTGPGSFSLVATGG